MQINPEPATGGGGTWQARSRPSCHLACSLHDRDGTNEATANIVWALFGNVRTHNCWQVRYFLLLGKCGTHQSALSAKNGVEGNVAAASAKDNTYKGVTENAVRLFKYLVPQY